MKTDFFAISAYMYCYFDFNKNCWYLNINKSHTVINLRIDIDGVKQLFGIRTSHLNYDSFEGV